MVSWFEMDNIENVNKLIEDIRKSLLVRNDTPLFETHNLDPRKPFYDKINIDVDDQVWSYFENTLGLEKATKGELIKAYQIKPDDLREISKHFDNKRRIREEVLHSYEKLKRTTTGAFKMFSTPGALEQKKINLNKKVNELNKLDTELKRWGDNYNGIRQYLPTNKGFFIKSQTTGSELGYKVDEKDVIIREFSDLGLGKHAMNLGIYGNILKGDLVTFSKRTVNNNIYFEHDIEEIKIDELNPENYGEKIKNFKIKLPPITTRVKGIDRKPYKEKLKACVIDELRGVFENKIWDSTENSITEDYLDKKSLQLGYLEFPDKKYWISLLIQKMNIRKPEVKDIGKETIVHEEFYLNGEPYHLVHYEDLKEGGIEVKKREERTIVYKSTSNSEFAFDLIFDRFGSDQQFLTKEGRDYITKGCIATYSEVNDLV